MSIGLPYKGSKSEIAEELVAKLPPCGKILDACCGGGAVLVALAQSLKYKSVVGNDRNPATIALLDAVLINKGQIEYEHPEPCSRNDFFVSLQRIENGDFTIQDCVNKFCASFGNDGKTYLYGSEIEPYKLEAEQMLTAKTLEERRGDCYKKPTAYWFWNCEPTYGESFQQPKEYKRIVEGKKHPIAGMCSEERSMISPDYARNFICDFILGKKQDIGQLSLF